MQLSEAGKKQIADEFAVIAQLIDDEKDAMRKAYYFSGSFGVVYRVLNTEFNTELVLMHAILKSTYTTLNTHLTKVTSGGERVIELPDNIFSVLSSSLRELATAISQNQDIYKPLSLISSIGYVATGNGYYLYRKGDLKLGDEQNDKQ